MTRRRRITIEASEEDVEALRGAAATYDYPGDPETHLRDLASRIEAALREEER